VPVNEIADKRLKIRKIMYKKETWEIGVSKRKLKMRGLLKTLETFCTTKQKGAMKIA